MLEKFINYFTAHPCLQKFYFAQFSVDGEEWLFESPLKRVYGFKSFSKIKSYYKDFNQTTIGQAIPHKRIVAYRFSLLYPKPKLSGIFEFPA